MLRTLALAGLTAAVLAGCGPRPGPGGAPAGPLPRIPDEVELPAVGDGRPIRLAAYRGKPLVILFFATWCVPCQLQLERIHQVRAALGRDRVSALGVSIDLDDRLVGPFVEAAGFDFAVAYGGPKLIRSGPLGAVLAVPRILILDATGRAVADFRQIIEGRTLYRVLQPLVRR